MFINKLGNWIQGLLKNELLKLNQADRRATADLARLMLELSDGGPLSISSHDFLARMNIDHSGRGVKTND